MGFADQYLQFNPNYEVVPKKNYFAFGPSNIDILYILPPIISLGYHILYFFFYGSKRVGSAYVLQAFASRPVKSRAKNHVTLTCPCRLEGLASLSKPDPLRPLICHPFCSPNLLCIQTSQLILTARKVVTSFDLIFLVTNTPFIQYKYYH